MLKIANFSNDPHDWNEFRNYRNLYKKSIQLKKFNWFQSKLNDVQGDSKKTWKVLNSILKDEQNTFDHILKNGDIIDNNETIANEFNQYFANEPLVIQNNIPNEEYIDDIQHIVNNKFEFSAVPKEYIMNILKQCNKKENRDNMNISMQILIDSFEMIGEMLTDVINCSFSTGVFPPFLKESVIIPIEKVIGTKKNRRISTHQHTSMFRKNIRKGCV